MPDAVSERLNRRWMVMRVADSGIASYQEVCTFWDLDEVLEWHEILDMRADQEWMNRPRDK